MPERKVSTDVMVMGISGRDGVPMWDGVLSGAFRLRGVEKMVVLSSDVRCVSEFKIWLSFGGSIWRALRISW